MTARRMHPFRLALEITLVLALILILTAGSFWAQARSSTGSANPAPAGSSAAEVQATPIPAVQAALMAAEMAALTPPQYIVSMPVIHR